MNAITGPWQKAQELGLTNIRATADGVVGEIGEYSVGIREVPERPDVLGDLDWIAQRGYYGSDEAISIAAEKIANIHRALNKRKAEPIFPHRPDIRLSCQMLRERFEEAKCDSHATEGCVRCNVMFLVNELDRAAED